MFTFAAFCYMLSLVLCVSLIFFAIWHVSIFFLNRFLSSPCVATCSWKQKDSGAIRVRNGARRLVALHIYTGLLHICGSAETFEQIFSSTQQVHTCPWCSLLRGSLSSHQTGVQKKRKKKKTPLLQHHPAQSKPAFPSIMKSA